MRQLTNLQIKALIYYSGLINTDSELKPQKRIINTLIKKGLINKVKLLTPIGEKTLKYLRPELFEKSGKVLDSGLPASMELLDKQIINMLNTYHSDLLIEAIQRNTNYKYKIGA